MDEDGDGGPCQHIESHKDHSIWVKPDISERMHSPAQKRTYCKKCGKIKYMGSARAKKMGFYVNLLKEIQRKAEVLNRRGITKHRLTHVQVRLILKELQDDEFFSDAFCTHQYSQWDRFKATLRKYCPLPEEAIEPVYRDFKG
ncbi:MAG: hypothetical protein JXA22_00805 [Candidatus Thermoplasmatota archaeon]|nr:hypothetical protein [Candidatus Thermoplasmatota archaeon]